MAASSPPRPGDSPKRNGGDTPASDGQNEGYRSDSPSPLLTAVLAVNGTGGGSGCGGPRVAATLSSGVGTSTNDQQEMPPSPTFGFCEGPEEYQIMTPLDIHECKSRGTSSFDWGTMHHNEECIQDSESLLDEFETSSTENDPLMREKLAQVIMRQDVEIARLQEELAALRSTASPEQVRGLKSLPHRRAVAMQETGTVSRAKVREELRAQLQSEIDALAWPPASGNVSGGAAGSCHGSVDGDGDGSVTARRHGSAFADMAQAAAAQHALPPPPVAMLPASSSFQRPPPRGVGRGSATPSAPLSDRRPMDQQRRSPDRRGPPGRPMPAPPPQFEAGRGTKNSARNSSPGSPAPTPKGAPKRSNKPYQQTDPSAGVTNVSAQRFAAAASNSVGTRMSSPRTQQRQTRQQQAPCSKASSESIQGSPNKNTFKFSPRGASPSNARNGGTSTPRARSPGARGSASTNSLRPQPLQPRGSVGRLSQGSTTNNFRFVPRSVSPVRSEGASSPPRSPGGRLASPRSGVLHPQQHQVHSAMPPRTGASPKRQGPGNSPKKQSFAPPARAMSPRQQTQVQSPARQQRDQSQQQQRLSAAHQGEISRVHSASALTPPKNSGAGPLLVLANAASAANFSVAATLPARLSRPLASAADAGSHGGTPESAYFATMGSVSSGAISPRVGGRGGGLPGSPGMRRPNPLLQSMSARSASALPSMTAAEAFGTPSSSPSPNVTTFSAAAAANGGVPTWVTSSVNSPPSAPTLGSPGLVSRGMPQQQMDSAMGNPSTTRPCGRGSFTDHPLDGVLKRRR
eukprot:TRINITY_DN12821_c0_g1_i2.p1 TRINITY_DN12821_c0_g1~~TRINITY_DN12821_c0_g1_i2.p1  ORF type:complete len:928 (+),score=122.47 TRINITY_DN12821_c0_g1_i2:382-2784(+)